MYIIHDIVHVESFTKKVTKQNVLIQSYLPLHPLLGREHISLSYTILGVEYSYNTTQLSKYTGLHIHCPHAGWACACMHISSVPAYALSTCMYMYICTWTLDVMCQ